MPRPKKEVDLSSFTDLGTKHWKEALKDNKFQLGVFTVSLCAEMLSPRGYTRNWSNLKTNTKGAITYDIEFVLEYAFRKIIDPLKFINGESLNEEGFDNFMDSLKKYSQESIQRKQRELLSAKAEELAIEFPGKSQEQWLDELIAANKPKQEVEPVKKQSKQAPKAA